MKSKRRKQDHQQKARRKGAKGASRYLKKRQYLARLSANKGRRVFGFEIEDKPW